MKAEVRRVMDLIHTLAAERMPEEQYFEFLEEIEYEIDRERESDWLDAEADSCDDVGI